MTKRSPHYGEKLHKVCRCCGTPFVVGFKRRLQILCSQTCMRAEQAAASIEQALDRQSIPEPNSGCWLWSGRAGRAGYGLIYAPETQTYKAAHRVAYERWIGPIPKGLLVCHHCDNPGCINPDHLFLGTTKDNADDMVRKGRGDNGGGYWGRIPDEAIRQFRELRALGATIKAAAQAAGFSDSHGSRVDRDLRRWRVTDGPAA